MQSGYGTSNLGSKLNLPIISRAQFMRLHFRGMERLWLTAVVTV